LIGDDAWNAALQKISHDRLADEAQAARYQKSRTFAHWIARLVLWPRLFSE
jgi:hypothetical protein